MNVGFVGVGAVARHHLAVISGQDDVSVTAVCDLDERRAQAVAEAIGARQHPDWQSMLSAEQLDALFVCTPPQAHAEPTVAALTNGVPVYVEKPLARELDDGFAIVSAWEESRAICAVGYQWRSLDLLADVRRALGGTEPGLLVSRSIGPTEPARADLTSTGSASPEPWFDVPRKRGGLLFELGSHDIDLQLALAGPVESVQAVASSGLLALEAAKTELKDSVAAILRFVGGGLGTIQVAWTSAQEPPLYALDILTASASLHLQLDPVFRLEGQTQAGSISVVGATNPRESTLTRFFDAVRRGDARAVACSPADALGTLQVALACEQAIATEKTVPVADVK